MCSSRAITRVVVKEMGDTGGGGLEVSLHFGGEWRFHRMAHVVCVCGAMVVISEDLQHWGGGGEVLYCFFFCHVSHRMR